MNILALDLSLTATGVCHPDGTTEILAPHKKDRGAARLHAITTAITYRTRGKADLVVIEGYAFGARGRATFNIGELGGCVRMLLFRDQIPFVEVPPACLKRYATGRGNATKDAVLSAAVLRSGRAMSNDEADAWWLWVMAMQHYNRPAGLPKMPKAHQIALGGVEWVDLRPVPSASAGGDGREEER